MAVIHMNFTSRSLTTKTDLYVVYPTPTLQDMIQHKDRYDPEKRWPVVYMLHGAGGDGFEWIQRADVEALCCKYGFIAVLPSVELGFYNNTPDGRAYYDYVTKELPAMVESTFHASDRAEDRYIMGYSMGGFGAVKIGWMNPERYHKIASLSGCMDVKGFITAFEGGSIFTIHTALAECVGHVVVSYNYCDFVRDLYQDFYILRFERQNEMSQRKGAKYEEAVITNYDPRPMLDSYYQQLDMFQPWAADQEQGELRLIHAPGTPTKLEQARLSPIR